LVWHFFCLDSLGLRRGRLRLRYNPNSYFDLI
jgi:hypothetical protein